MFEDCRDFQIYNGNFTTTNKPTTVNISNPITLNITLNVDPVLLVYLYHQALVAEELRVYGHLGFY